MTSSSPTRGHLVFLSAIVFALSAAVGCDGNSATGDGDGDGQCVAENHCEEHRDGTFHCEEGYDWEDESDSDNFNCVEEGNGGDGDGGDGDGGDGDGGDGDGGDGDGGDGDGGDGDGGDGDGGDGDGDGDGSLGDCDGQCADTYSACTCDPSDPCNWQGDGYCDAQCGEVLADTFDDAEDCAGGDGDGDGGGGTCPPNSSMNADMTGCVCDEGFTVNEDMTACVSTACDGACGSFTYNACTCAAEDACGWSDDGYCDSGDMACGAFDPTFEDYGDCGYPCSVPADCDGLGDGFTCSNDICVIDVGTPPDSTPQVCDDVPDWYCTGGEATCGDIVEFAPDMGDGYWDYPLNGETTANQYRSYARVDLMQLVKYATAKVACQAPGWAGNGGLLGLGDMSEANGDIPGTSVGQPGHPEGTHVNGHDMDIAYYQSGTANNQLRAVCDHVSGGQDQYHCVNPPDKLDVWRTALFIAHLHDTHQLRVIGVDGQIGELVAGAIPQLCTAGFYDGPACNNLKLAYEVTDGGAGWFRFHHHHLHVSLNSWSTKPAGWTWNAALPGDGCLVPGCGEVPLAVPAAPVRTETPFIELAPTAPVLKTLRKTLAPNGQSLVR